MQPGMSVDRTLEENAAARDRLRITKDRDARDLQMANMRRDDGRRVTSGKKGCQRATALRRKAASEKAVRPNQTARQKRQKTQPTRVKKKKATGRRGSAQAACRAAPRAAPRARRSGRRAQQRPQRGRAAAARGRRRGRSKAAEGPCCGGASPGSAEAQQRPQRGRAVAASRRRSSARPPSWAQ